MRCCLRIHENKEAKRVRNSDEETEMVNGVKEKVKKMEKKMRR